MGVKLWGLYRRDKGFVGDRRHRVYGAPFPSAPLLYNNFPFSLLT